MRIKWIRDKVEELRSSLARIRTEAERSDRRLAQDIADVADDLTVCATELDLIVQVLLERRSSAAEQERGRAADADAG